MARITSSAGAPISRPIACFSRRGTPEKRSVVSSHGWTFQRTASSAAARATRGQRRLMRAVEPHPLLERAECRSEIKCHGLEMVRRPGEARNLPYRSGGSEARAFSRLLSAPRYAFCPGT